MNLYEQVKVQSSHGKAAERYGLPVGHSGKACCPFHDDHIPSMKLYDATCFLCGTGKSALPKTNYIKS